MAGYGSVPTDRNATNVVSDPAKYLGNGAAFQLSPLEISVITSLSIMFTVLIIIIFLWRCHMVRLKNIEAVRENDLEAGRRKRTGDGAGADAAAGAAATSNTGPPRDGFPVTSDGSIEQGVELQTMPPPVQPASTFDDHSGWGPSSARPIVQQPNPQHPPPTTRPAEVQLDAFVPNAHPGVSKMRKDDSVSSLTRVLRYNYRGAHPVGMV